MRHIILDTDIDGDVDDAGALAVLHNLATAQECEILGIVCCAPVDSCPGAVRAINEWYHRGDLAIGWIGGQDIEQLRWAPYMANRAKIVSGEWGFHIYNDYLATDFPVSKVKPESAVRCYRRLLAQSSDASVTICSIGTLNVLAELLESEPDELCALSGRQLVALKVRELVSMAIAFYPNGRDGFNWGIDAPSAAKVIRDWPTMITVSPSGEDILTGKNLIAKADARHPVREAYIRFLGGEDRNRSSWDQVAVLYAVRGTDAPFALSGPRHLTFDAASGFHQWGETVEQNEHPRRIVIPILPPDSMGALIENLMC
jgi:purine nucleosidase